MIDSAISKRQRGQNKHSFLEKKILHKRENEFTISIQKKHHYKHHSIDRAIKQLTDQFHKIFFYISKCLACNTEKYIAVEDNQKRLNKANFVKTYI